MFSEEDIQQITERGLTVEAVRDQIDRFQTGYPFLKMIRPATIGDGIIKVTEPNNHIDDFHKQLDTIGMIRFIPASGAASRMFKSLFEFSMESGTTEMPPDVNAFIQGLEILALTPDLEQKIAESGRSLQALLELQKYREVIQDILRPEGLNYGNLPKALIKFHRYSGRNRTALEEHLVEGAMYNKDQQGVVRIHFTISPEHRQPFQDLLKSVQSIYEQKFGVQYSIDFSYQKPATDTIAVDLSNQPFRDGKGHLLFRPGGHGALLENLNDLDADLIFIKNIDNVSPDRLKEPTVTYKKVLAGILLQIRSRIFSYLNRLESNQEVSTEFLEEVDAFLMNELYIEYKKPSHVKSADHIRYMITKLNRPIRVCGMVRNEGEPGGGPFFAENADGTISLQVVESSQIDLSVDKNRRLMEQATHFNPVDLVCSVKDHHGKKFDLRRFRDENTGFISTKSSEGKDLKALEWPGLWNGAMSDWNTIFVEVPIETFNPVKTINDLLRPMHQ